MIAFELAAACAEGTTLVTPNNRLARTLVAHHDAGMVRAGHRTWNAARALPWSAWLGTLWREASDTQAIVPALRLLAPVESNFLWHRLVAADVETRATARSAGASVLAADAWALAHGVPAAELARVAKRIRRFDPALFAGWAERYRRELERLARSIWPWCRTSWRASRKRCPKARAGRRAGDSSRPRRSSSD
jgi:hypothetical protein